MYELLFQEPHLRNIGVAERHQTWHQEEPDSDLMMGLTCAALRTWCKWR